MSFGQHTIAEMNVVRGTDSHHQLTVLAIADNVFRARQAARVTRKSMASAVGVTATTLWRKEAGGTEFKASELVAIAKMCRVDVGQLLAVRAHGAECEAKALNVHRGG